MIYSRNMATGVLIATTDTVVFTVPAGETWVVKQLDIVNVTATARYLNFYRNAAVASGAFRNRIQVLANFFVSERELFEAFEAGDTLRSIAEAANALRVTAWGYKLLEP